MASLFVIQGRDQGTRYQLGESVHTIGRTHANSIRLHDTEVSRTHAELHRCDESYVLRDLGSSNGTFVNGRLVEEQSLRSGDQVQVGRSLLLYTGFVDDRVADAVAQVAIVPRAESSRGSRIVASLSQTGGSEWLLPEAGDSSNPSMARARSNLQIMYRTALAASHTMDIDELLARIMEMIFDWVSADRGCIMLKDLQTGRLTPKVRRHRRGMRSDEKIAISKTILDYVMDRNEGVLTSDARDDDRFDAAQSIVTQGIREAICVPMQGRYDAVGVIYIDTATAPQRSLAQSGANQFTEEHLRLMIAIAHQAALAVEDTSYYKALVQAERLAAIGQTIASLSHHIKNILQGVSGGSYLIQLGIDGHEKALHAADAAPAGGDATAEAFAKIRKGWGLVQRNQERISALVMDMLTFSKEREPEPRPSQLNEVTAEVLELMASRAAELGVDLVGNPAPDMPTLMFDSDALHRAILNVVTNAMDACAEDESGPDNEPWTQAEARAHEDADGRDSKETNLEKRALQPPLADANHVDPAEKLDQGDLPPQAPPQRGRVEVTTHYAPEQHLASVVVADNGPGISPEDIEAIFTVFVSRKGGRGTGLGLTVSRKILEEHGGQIRVESTEGKGSTFTLEFPAALVSDEGAGAQRRTQSIALEEVPRVSS